MLLLVVMMYVCVCDGIGSESVEVTHSEAYTRRANRSSPQATTPVSTDCCSCLQSNGQICVRVRPSCSAQQNERRDHVSTIIA